MIDRKTVEDIVNRFTERTNYFLTGVEVKPGNEIVVEIDCDDAASIDDCVLLSKQIEAELDRDREDFSLEVGTAGIGSPFRCQRQYRKNIGNEVEVLTTDGRKLTGVLREVADDGCTIEVERMVRPEGAKRKTRIVENLDLKYSEIKKANYLIRFK
jgi:ribosome maturation factor RimP